MIIWLGLKISVGNSSFISSLKTLLHYLWDFIVVVEKFDYILISDFFICDLFLLLPIPKILGSFLYPYLFEIILIVTWVDLKKNIHFTGYSVDPFKLDAVSFILKDFLSVISVIIYLLHVFSPCRTPVNYKVELLIDTTFYYLFGGSFP